MADIGEDYSIHVVSVNMLLFAVSIRSSLKNHLLVRRFWKIEQRFGNGVSKTSFKGESNIGETYPHTRS